MKYHDYGNFSSDVCLVCGKEFDHLDNPFGECLGVAAPSSFEAFVNSTREIFLAKNADYDSRFMRALIEHQGSGGSRALWAWEVDKKLDRLRTWLKRGELQVKGEGIQNSVDDLFIYTVQYCIWLQSNTASKDQKSKLLDSLNGESFKETATIHSAYLWVSFLIDSERIKSDETELQTLVLKHMGAQ